jgi:GntR family transcriptional regulator
MIRPASRCPKDLSPIYLQIVNQIKTQVALGRLHPEDPLPSVRQLAVDLTVNPNTIARAYLDLEHEGVIYKRPGQGTYVSARAVQMAKSERVRIFGELLERAVVEGVYLDLSTQEMTEAFERLIARITASEARRQ